MNEIKAYIAIDTCSWRKIIKAEEVNPLLLDLEYWVKNNHIRVIVPETIVEEWNKHREVEINHITQSWKAKIKHFNQIAEKENLPIPSNFYPNINFINEQIKIIDDIVLNENLKIEISDYVKQIIPDKTIKKLAPFHNKIDSTKDAYIYFSSVEFCSNNNINELLFISDNKNDFGEPVGNKKGSPNKIHSDLLTDFPSVNIEYFADIGLAITKLKEKLPSRSETVSSQIHNNNLKDKYFTINNEELSVHEQLYKLYKKIEEEINFLPVQILKDLPPFKADNNKYTYHTNFTLTTNNEDLFNYLEGLVNKVKNNEKINEQEIYILENISDNLIFNIQLAESSKYIDTFYSKQKKSDCLYCTYYRFEFHKTFKKLGNEPKDLKGKLEIAYVHYQIGNYLKAAELYFQISEEAEKLKKNLIFFISQFNLSKLYIFIRNRYFDNKQAKSIQEKIKNINIQKVALKIDIKIKNRFINRLVSHDFIDNSIFTILDFSNKIIDHYYSQLNGGWSENSHIHSLIHKYAELDAFLNSNYIIYDNFKEYKTLFRRVLESLFASHAITEKQCKRIDTFDDYWISKIVYYGNKDDIIRFFNRYNLKELKYKQSSKNDGSFYDKINNVLSIENDLRASFKEHCELDYNSFWERYDNIFKNLFTLASLLNIDDAAVNDITKKTINFLSDSRMVGRNTADALRIFFTRRGKDIDEELLKEVFNIAVSNQLLHDKNFIEIVLNEIGKKKGVIDVTDKFVKDFIQSCLMKCKKCEATHPKSELIAFFMVVSKEKQEAIKGSIEKKLEENIDFDLFYLSSLYDVIDFNPDFFNKFIKQLSPPKKYSDRNLLFFNSERYHIRVIDDLINLGFKNHIDFSESKFDLIRNYHPYYKWLFDMDNFEYSDFDVDWITEYRTLYYQKEMAKSTKLNEYLTKYIKHNNNKLIERIYFDINHINDK